MSKVIEKKKPKLPRRARVRDWPRLVYSFHAEIVGDLPEWVSAVEKDMRACWNDMAFDLKRTLKPLREARALDKEKREAVKPFRDTKTMRGYVQQYKGKLPSDAYYALADRFLKAMQEAPRVRKTVRQIKGVAFFETGLPRPKYDGDPMSLNLPVVFNACEGDETTFADLYDSGGSVSLWRLPEAAPGAGHNVEFRIKKPQLDIPVPDGLDKIQRAKWRKKYRLENTVPGKQALQPIRLLAAFHRLPPPHAIVKKVALIRREIAPFGSKWSLQFTLEMPPLDFAREPVGRIAGYDSGGWRIFEDRIRIGVLTDNAGHSYEISVPRDMAGREARAARDYFGQEFRPVTTWNGLIEIDERIGAAVQECKHQLAELYASDKEVWPEDARQMMSELTKMRQQGLMKLRDALAARDSSDAAITAPLARLQEWLQLDMSLYRRKRAFEMKAQAAKLDAYRKIAAWLAKNFDVIAWEGNLSLKEMAEAPTDSVALKRAQRQRQIVGQSNLRLFVRQACKKFRCDLRDAEAAYSTKTCPECGGEVEQTGKLLLMCENGHRSDQDVSASKFLFKQIEGAASISGKPVEIPADLHRYLRLMSVSETAVEVS